MPEILVDVKVRPQTQQRLIMLKKLNESFDEELNRLMDIAEEQGAQ